MPSKSITGAFVAIGVMVSVAFVGSEIRQDTRIVPEAMLTLVSQDSLHIRVLAMTDFHGALESRTYPGTGQRLLGGAAVLKAAMDSAEAECGCPTLRIDAGDQMQGTLPSNLFFGASTVEALNLLGLDVAAIGNHELDWSVDTLRQRISEADYPWLAANVFDSLTGRRPEWAQPYHITELSGLRVAFIGFMTSTTKGIVYAPRTAGLAFGSGRAAIDDVLAAVRAEGPDLTILTAHAGMTCNAGRCSGEIVSLARELDPSDIDLIVAGHPHGIATAEINGIPIIQAGANGAALGVVDLFRVDGEGWRAEMIVRRVYADEVTPDASVLEMLSSYKRTSDAIANQTVATLRDAPVRRDGESELGNVIADALRDASGADIAFMNNGGIRTTVPAGPVRYGLLYRVMPFDNQLVRLTISGRDLRRFLEQALGRGSLSGVRITYAPRRADGSRIVDARLVDGSPLVDDRTYTIAVGNYLAEGGDGYTILRDLPREDIALTSLDALVAHLQAAPQPFAIPRDRRVVRVN